MDFKVSFAPEDYKAIAAELFVLIKAAAAQAPVAAPAPVQAPYAPPVVTVAPTPPVVLQPLPAAPAAPFDGGQATVPTMDGVTFRRQQEVQGGSSTGDIRNDTRIDDKVSEGTPGTVKMLKTGHVLSVPQPDKESFGGYVGRVYQQCGSAIPQVGLAMYAGDAQFADYGGFKKDGSNWPIAADRLYNPLAYTSDAAKAATEAYNRSIGWDGVPGHVNDPWISKPTAAQPANPQVPRIINNPAPAPAPETVFIQS